MNCINKMLSLYICIKCNRTFDRKSKYKRHINKQKPCSDNILSSQMLEKCKYCVKLFNSYDLRNHLNDIESVCHYKEYLENLNYRTLLTDDKKGIINVNVICTNKDDIENFNAVNNKKQTRKKYSNRVRNIIGARQKWCCASCSEMFGPVWHVDHVIPLVSKENFVEDEKNLQGLCVNCHAIKTNQEGIKYNF